MVLVVYDYRVSRTGGHWALFAHSIGTGHGVGQRGLVELRQAQQRGVVHVHFDHALAGERAHQVHVLLGLDGVGFVNGELEAADLVAVAHERGAVQTLGERSARHVMVSRAFSGVLTRRLTMSELRRAQRARARQPCGRLGRGQDGVN